MVLHSITSLVWIQIKCISVSHKHAITSEAVLSTLLIMQQLIQICTNHLLLTCRQKRKALVCYRKLVIIIFIKNVIYYLCLQQLHFAHCTDLALVCDVCYICSVGIFLLLTVYYLSLAFPNFPSSDNFFALTGGLWGSFHAVLV